MEYPYLISICVAHYNNGERLLVPFLETMLQTLPDNVEMVICNNGSTDNSDHILKAAKAKWGDRLNYKNCIDNLGFAGGSNMAYEMSRGKYILFLNNDVIADKKDWILDLLKVWEAEKGKALVGPQLVEFNSLTEVLDYGPTPYLNGWCVFGSREQFQKIGVFDTEFKVGFFEDVDLSARAVKEGYKLVQIKEIGVTHLGSQTVKDLNPTEMTRRNRPYFRTLRILYEREKKKNLRITFIVPGNYKFYDGDWEGKGVGGAEASLICLTRALAKAGHEVWVFNNCSQQGTFNGVHYAHLKTFEHSDYSDVAILFREPFHNSDYINANVILFWSCDPYTVGDWRSHVFPFVDKFIAISNYHKNYIERNLNVNPDFIEVIDLGINAPDYEKLPEKIKGKMIFCSVPHRGLINIKDIFPKIKAQVPEAELVITSDYTLWGAEDPDTQAYYDIKQLKGVKYLSKVPRKDLVYHQLSSQIMLYPCTYEEMFCISAAECIAAGAVPVTVPIGAVTTTVGDSGILVTKDKYKDGFDGLVTEAVKLLTDEKLRMSYQNKGRERMLKKYNWDFIAQKWLNLFKEVSKQKKKGGESSWQKKTK